MSNHKLPTEVLIKLEYDPDSHDGIKAQRYKETTRNMADKTLGCPYEFICEECGWTLKAMDDMTFTYTHYCPMCGREIVK